MSEPTRVSPGLMRIFKIQTAIIASIVLWIVVVEGVLRCVPLPGLTSEDLNPSLLEDESQLRNNPHPYLAYSLTPGYEKKGKASHAKHNSLGFRGPETTVEKPKGVFRIACLGGSSTYGHTPSSNETTWPARLEHYLQVLHPERKIEVINAGVSGYSTFESLVNLSFRVINFEPDLVIVYHTINDMRCALYREPEIDNSHWRAVWRREHKSAPESWFEGSMTYLIVRKYFTDYFERKGDLASVVIKDFKPKTDQFKTEIVDATGFRNFNRNLRSILAVATAHGADLMIGTQGFDRRDIHGPSREAQIEAMKRMTVMLWNFGKKNEVPVVGTAAILAGASVQQMVAGEDQTIFSHEVHLYDDGADLLGKSFAEAITEQGLIP